MQRRLRFAVLILVLILTPGACAAPPAMVQPVAPSVSPTLIPTVAPSTTPPPSPTPLPRFAAGSTIAGVEVAGLSMAEAEQRLREALADLPAPLNLRAGAARLTLEPGDLKLQVPIEALLEQGARALAAGRPADLPLEMSFDPAGLQDALEQLAAEAAVPPSLQLITATDELSRSFAYTPGRILDLEAAFRQVAGRLADPAARGILRLDLVEDPTPPAVSKERLLEEVEALAAEWKGVTGFYLYDLQDGEELAMNADTVFAGASTIKVAIMLNAYANIPRFSALQKQLLDKMIIESDNLAANDLMAMAAGGRDTTYAFKGAEQMSAMLAELGLTNTYLYVPYESTDYIRKNNVKYKCGPQDPVGPKPYTETGCALRATPYQIGQIYRWIDECSHGEGPLPAVSRLLTPARCREMLDRLAENGDTIRFASGLPEGSRLEHKSGWIPNMQADAGIIRSPGGDVVLAVYLYRALPKDVYLWSDGYVAPYLGAFARLVHSAYNPVRLGDDTP